MPNVVRGARVSGWRTRARNPNLRFLDTTGANSFGSISGSEGRMKKAFEGDILPCPSSVCRFFSFSGCCAQRQLFAVVVVAVGRVEVGISVCEGFSV